MIGLKAIASAIPAHHIDNYKQGADFGEKASFIEDKIGAHKLPLMDETEDASDLGAKAVQALIAQSDLNPDDIDALIVVTQNPDGYGLPHCSAHLHRKLGLSNRVAAFDISLGCSGYVYGLSVMKGLMENAGLKNGVLVTADPYSKVIDRKDRVTSLLFGDAASASWLCADGSWKIGTPVLQTDGAGADNLYVDDETKLHMNGRQVFNFAATSVPRQINAWLTQHERAAEEIDLFCLHQGSAGIIDAIARRFPAIRDRFILDIANTGNTVSSSIPLLLERHVMNSDAKTVLVSGFGVGLSWATNIIERS